MEDFQLLFEQSPDILLVLLPDAPRYTMVAATRARLVATHTTLDQILGRGLFELFPDNPDDPAASGTANLRASLDRVRATCAADTMAVQKYDIRGPDGSFEVKYWSPKNLPVLRDGEVAYILHRVEDVTDLVRASEAGTAMEREVIARSRELATAVGALRDANARLGELDASKTAFFSNVSHEFRTPLTLMLGPLEDSLAAADDGERLGAAQRARVQVAHDNALRLLKLVNGLLDFSSLEAGRMRATFAPLDLSTFTAELAAMFSSAVAKAPIELVIDCPPLAEPVWVDREMWEKIVPNLVGNAFKFTRAGEIAVRLRDQASHIVLEVSDTGIGIPEPELPRIFDRFHRVANAQARTHEGTGIGLSLVRELVELHHGRVSVASTPGQGTTFRVELPKGFAHLPEEAISHAPVRAGIRAATKAHAIEAARWGQTAKLEPKREIDPDTDTAGPEERIAERRARVLVVDDNNDLREYIAGVLAPGYDVTVAVDGQDALDQLGAGLAVDLLVSDVMMPRLDGVGLVKQLRAQPATATLPVILLSARAGEDASIEGLDAGSDDYLVKPFSARELLARVRTHVELARTRAAWAAELERKNHELEAFSYSVSHDLRAPLRAIDGFTHMVIEQTAAGSVLDDEARGYLRRVRAATARMSQMIDDLLRLAMVGRGPLHRGSVDVTAIARELAGELSRRDPDRRAKFVIADGMTVDGDAGLVRTVLENLLGNAWKFTAPRELAVIEVAVVGGVCAVRDNGVGFDADYGDKLFRPFQRLHSASEFEGHGIGLATVQRIVARHGGRVWAVGARDAGATMYFSL